MQKGKSKDTPQKRVATYQVPIYNFKANQLGRYSRKEGYLYWSITDNANTMANYHCMAK